MIVVPFFGVLLAISGLIGQRVSWFDLGLLVAGYVVTVLGVTAGYHRLFTHRSFVAPPTAQDRVGGPRFVRAPRLVGELGDDAPSSSSAFRPAG